MTRLTSVYGSENECINKGSACCGSLLDMLVSREVLSKFSKTGVSKTIGLKKLKFDNLTNIKKLLFNVIRNSDNKFTLQMFENVLSRRLKNGNSRAKSAGPQRKSGTKNRPKNLIYKKKVPTIDHEEIDNDNGELAEQQQHVDKLPVTTGTATATE